MKPPLDSFIKSPYFQPEEKEVDIKVLRGKKGDKGEDGQDADADEVALILQEPVTETLLEVLKEDTEFLGQLKGEPGTSGKDADEIDIVEVTERVSRLMPKSIDEKKLLKTFLEKVPKQVESVLDTPDEVVEKVNKAKKKINKSQIKGFDDIESQARSANEKVQKYLLMGGSTLVKLQANGVPLGDFSTLNFTNGTVTNTGGTANYTGTGGGGGSGYQSPLSGGLTGTNAWATAPNVIVIDGIPRQKTQTDGTVMWTGTTTTVLTGAPLPTFDIFSSA